MDKKINENLYNEKSLYLLNIKELRDLGRKIGVPAPATLNKQDLIDYILKIVYGQVEVPIRNSFGRPNVREVNISHYLDKIKKKLDFNDELINASPEEEDVSSIFKVASADEFSKTQIIQQRIFVDLDGKYFLREYAFVESDTDLKVPTEIKLRFGLDNFDVVEVIISGKSFKIISINGKVINNIKKLDSDFLGKKQVFHLSTKDKINKEILKIIKRNEENDITTIIFSKEEYHGGGVEHIKTDNSKDEQHRFKQLMTLVNICEKYVFDGENIVVITDQSDFIEDIFDSLDADVSQRCRKFLQNKINDIIALGNALIVFKLETEAIYQ